MRLSWGGETPLVGDSLFQEAGLSQLRDRGFHTRDCTDADVQRLVRWLNVVSNIHEWET